MLTDGTHIKNHFIVHQIYFTIYIYSGSYTSIYLASFTNC